MRSYSIVFLDIDGTLLDSHHHVMPQTKQLLNRLERWGVPIILCSARSPGGVEMVSRQVELHSPVVCYSGGLISGFDGSILRDVGIEPSLAVCFKEFAAKHHPDVVVSAYLYDVWLTDDPEHPVIQREAHISQCTPIKGALKLAAQSATHIHKLLCIGNSEQILALQNEAIQRFPQLVFLRSSTTYLEAMSPDGSKCAAVEDLRIYYGVSRDETVAFGDSFVDMDMLQYAGLGVAMGNAPEPVKEIADLVTASNDEEGIYTTLKNLRFKVPPLKQQQTENMREDDGHEAF